MKKIEEQLEPVAVMEPKYDPSEEQPTKLEHFAIYNK